MIVEKMAKDLEIGDELSTDGYKLHYKGTVVDPVYGNGVYLIFKKDGREKEAVMRPEDKLPIWIKDES